MIYGLTAMVIATTLILNAYAVTNEDKIRGAQAALTAAQVSDLLKDAGEIMDTCTLQATFGIVSNSCIKFITDMRDSLKVIVNNTNVTMTDGDFDKMIQNLQTLGQQESSINTYP